MQFLLPLLEEVAVVALAFLALGLVGLVAQLEQVAVVVQAGATEQHEALSLPEIMVHSIIAAETVEPMGAAALVVG